MLIDTVRDVCLDLTSDNREVSFEEIVEQIMEIKPEAKLETIRRYLYKLSTNRQIRLQYGVTRGALGEHNVSDIMFWNGGDDPECNGRNTYVRYIPGRHPEPYYPKVVEPYHVQEMDNEVEVGSLSYKREIFRNALAVASGVATDLFMSNAKSMSKAEFVSGGMLFPASPTNYAFMKGDKAIYIGQNSRNFKKQPDDNTSTQSEWFNDGWDHILYMTANQKSERIVFETLLIVGMRPLYNKSPGSFNIEDMFSDWE